MPPRARITALGAAALLAACSAPTPREPAPSFFSRQPQRISVQSPEPTVDPRADLVISNLVIPNDGSSTTFTVTNRSTQRVRLNFGLLAGHILSRLRVDDPHPTHLMYAEPGCVCGPFDPDTQLDPGVPVEITFESDTFSIADEHMERLLRRQALPISLVGPFYAIEHRLTISGPITFKLRPDPPRRPQNDPHPALPWRT